MLKFDSVSIGYHKVPLIKNLSVEIPTGSITTIVGPNGCGKTTLISVLNKSSQLYHIRWRRYLSYEWTPSCPENCIFTADS